jgi:hypothetical protein
MDRPEAEGAAPVGATVAHSAMQVAAWRQLWRLLLQPLDDESEQHEAASWTEAANEETHDVPVHVPK